MNRKSLHMTARDAITEGLFDHEDDVLDAQIQAQIDLDEEALAFQSHGAFDQDPCGWLDDTDADTAYDLWAHEEPVAEWEYVLLTGDDDHDSYLAYADEHRAMRERNAEPVEVEPEDEPEQPHWLAASLEDAFPNGGYVVEGVTPEVSIRATGYMRVHELAREVGIRAGHMVEALRTHGEYVRGTASYVALPVCDRVLTLEVAEYLRSHYGERPDREALESQRRLADLRARLLSA